MDEGKREELDVLDAAEDLLHQGLPESALELLDDADPEDPNRWLLAVSAWSDLGAWGRAEAAFAALRRTSAEGDPHVDFCEGRLRLMQWRTAEARACFARVPEDVGGASILEYRAMLEDLEGHLEAADALYARAHTLDPVAASPPLRLAPSAFRTLVNEAAEALPDEFRAALATMAVVIDPMPTAAIVGAPESGHPPDVLGLFVGLPLHENEARGHGELPPTIFLFQRNLERIAPDEAALREQVHVTLYHELGHALGFDEDGVDAMGLR